MVCWYGTRTPLHIRYSSTSSEGLLADASTGVLEYDAVIVAFSTYSSTRVDCLIRQSIPVTHNLYLFMTLCERILPKPSLLEYDALPDAGTVS